MLRLGTRKSQLAMVQAQLVQKKLEALGVPIKLVPIESQGDKDRKTPLYEMEGQEPGLFTKQLEKALLDRQIDLAVHSLKDLPTESPKGLQVISVVERIETQDVLVYSPNVIDDLAPLNLQSGTLVGTSSLRRQAQIAEKDSQLRTAPIRGNVPTRIEAVRKGKIGAVVLAKAGLARLRLDLSGLKVKELDPQQFIPAPGQGAIAIETRDDLAPEAAQKLQSTNCEWAAKETRIERRILRALEGGCTLPLGVRCWASAKDKPMKLRAFLGIESKSQGWEHFYRFDICEADEETLISKTIAYFRGVK